MTRTHSWTVVVAVTLIACVLPVRAVGQTEEADALRSEARAIFDRANVLMENENWEVALAEFRRSFDLYPTRSALFNLAMCEKALHRYRAALEHFALWQNDYSGAATEGERDSVANAIADLRQFVGQLVVSTDPAGATVRIDGEEAGTTPLAAPITVDAALHRVEATLEGHVPVEREVLVGPLQTAELALVLEPVATVPFVPVVPPVVSEPAPDDGVHQGWFWTVAASAAAAGIGGAVAGGIALSTESDLDDLGGRCQAGDDAACDEGMARMGDYDDAQLATNVLLFTAAGLAATAVVLALFTDFGFDDEELPVAVGAAPTVDGSGMPAGATVGVTLFF